LKIGLTVEEIFLIVNIFEGNSIDSSSFISKIKSLAECAEKLRQEEEKGILGLLTQLYRTIEKAEVSPDRLFFEFDKNSNGQLTLEKFQNMLRFLKINLFDKL